MKVSGHILRGFRGRLGDGEQNVLDERRHDARRVANGELQPVGSCPFAVPRRVDGQLRAVSKPR